MQASQLLLDQYYLEELRFSLDEKYVFEEKDVALLAEDLDVKVEALRHPTDPLQWFFKLGVVLNDKTSKFPYDFALRLAGFFEVSKDCKPDMIEQLVMINAPSILYAAARELLAIISARSRYLSIFLPSIRFFGPPPKAIEAPGQYKQKAGAIKTTAKPRGRKTRSVASKKK